MRRVLIFVPAILLTFCLSVNAEEPRTFSLGNHRRGSLAYHRSVPVLTLRGTPEEMGEQQAALLKDVVKPMLKYPREVVRRHGLNHLWPLVSGMGTSLMMNAPERFQIELTTIAKRGGFDINAMRVGNTMLELRRMGGCAALLVNDKRTSTDGPLFARNFDFPAFGVLHKYSLVTVYRPKGKFAFVSVGFPGLVGVISGMNEHGLTVATLDVMSSNDKSPMFQPLGVPMAFTFRRILEECKTTVEAEKVLREVTHTTWMNLAVGDPNTNRVFELTPATVNVRQPEKDLLSCTNHFRTEGLTTNRKCWRIDILDATRRKTDLLSIADVASRMHAVNQGGLTLQTMVFEPKSLKLHLAIGQPPVSGKPLETLDLKPLFQRNENER